MILSAMFCFPEENRTAEKIPDKITSLLELSLRSPSSHNAQMWKIRYEGDKTVGIYIDEERLLDKVDPGKREAYISIGSLCESIVSAAGEYSLDAEVEYGENSNPVVWIKFTDTDTAEEKGISELIRRRCTVRGKFEKKDLSPDDISYLSASSEGNIEYYPGNSETGKEIAYLAVKASAIQTENDRKQEELSSWFRFSRKEAKKRNDGITPEMMGFKGLARDFIYLIFNEKTAMKKSFRRSTDSVIRKQVDNCSGFFTISTEAMDTQHLVETGRTLQRIWLRAVERGIAFHPMSQIIEEGETLKQLYKFTGVEKRNIQMIIRAGYIDEYPKPSSRRRSLEDILEWGKK